MSSVSDKENPTVHLVLIVMPRKTIKKKAVSTVEKTDEAQALTASPLEQVQEVVAVTTSLTVVLARSKNDFHLVSTPLVLLRCVAFPF